MRMRKQTYPVRWGLGVAMVSAVVLALTSCAGSSGPGAVEEDAPGTYEELVAAAQEEGTVTLYGGVDESTLQGIADAFEDEYGITVEFQRLTSGEQVKIADRQFQAGNVEFDVSYLADEIWVADGVEKGYWGDLDAEAMPELKNLPDELRYDQYAVVGTSSFGLIYNTELVAEEDVPTSLEDLLDPRWKGRLVFQDPELGGRSALGTLFSWQEHLGDDFKPFLEEFLANDPEVIVGSEGMQLVGAGERDILVMAAATFAAPAQDAGVPVELMFIDPGAVFTRVAQVPAKAEHPNAGRLLVNWMLSESGQQIVNGNYQGAPPYDVEVETALDLPSYLRYLSPDELRTGTIGALDAWLSVYR